MAAVVVPLIGKTDGDAVIGTGPEFFDQAVVEFAAPFALQKSNNGLAPLDKLGPIAPDAVAAVGHGDPLGVAAIPAVFGQTHFLGGRCGREGRQGRAGSFSYRLVGGAGGHGEEACLRQASLHSGLAPRASPTSAGSATAKVVK